MGISAGPDIIESGLVLELDAADRNSYPGSGTAWNDLSGNSNTGTLTNGPTFSTVGGGAIVFDGTNDLVSIPNSTSINPSNQISLSSWFRFNVLPAGEIALLRKDGVWQLGFISSNSIRCLLASTGTSGWTTANDTTYTFVTNTWYNMVMTFNNSNMLIYVNNSLVKTATVTGTIVTNTNVVNMGYVGFGTVYLNGSVASAQIYNRALTAAEIAQNYNQMKTRFDL